MRRICTRAKSIKYAIYVILAVLIITIFPLRLWHEEITTKGNEHAAGTIEVGGDKLAMQQFRPEYDHLNSIGIFVQGDYYSDSLALRVFDENFTLLRDVTVNTDDYKSFSNGAYMDIYINLDTKVGKDYYYSLEGLTTDFIIPIQMTANSGTTNNGYVQYAGENRDAYSIVGEYVYEQPMRKIMSLVWIGVIALIGFAITLLINLLSKSGNEKLSGFMSELVTPEWILKIVGTPIIVALLVVALVFIIPLHVFSIMIADIVILSIGALLLAGILLYLIWRDHSDSIFDIITYMQENWQNLLQSLFIALAFMACVKYMNALYEVFHDIEWRRMVLFIGLSLIVTFKRKEFFNIFNIVAIIAGAITGRIYFVNNLADMVDEYHVKALKMTSFVIPVIFVMVVFIIRTIVLAIYDYIKKPHETERISLSLATKNISWPYTIVTLILAIGMVIMRNERTWPVMMLITFAVVGFKFLFTEDKKAFANNVANAVLLHFFGAMLYSLWHRPWEAYEFSRYPFVFHTVTVTACYLSLVVVVALAKLMYKYNQTHKLRDCIFEMILFGAPTSYMLFTMSRTGILSVAVAGIVCWIAIISGKKKITDKPKLSFKFKSLLASAGTVMVAVIVCFPICFSLQKTVPGVVGEAKLMEIERYPEEVVISSDLTDEHFISFGRFSEVFLHKLLGMPENDTILSRATIYGIEERNTQMLIMDENGNFIDPDGRIVDPEGNIIGQTDTIDNKETEAIVAADISATVSDSRPLITSEIAATSKNAIIILQNAKNKGDFVPPHEYSADGEPPAEWWDENYWFYNSATDEWEFGYWMLMQEEADSGDVSNGRMDIYRSYLEQLTMEGHESMGAILADGSEAAHAHDIYLQVAFDHGMIIGTLFALWVVMTCIQALIVFLRRRTFDPASGVILSVSVTYAVAGVTEWISHPCNPLGLAILLIIIPLALDGRRKTAE